MFHRPRDSDQEVKQQDAPVEEPQERAGAPAPQQQDQKSAEKSAENEQKQEKAAGRNGDEAAKKTETTETETKTTEEKTMTNPQSDNQDQKEKQPQASDMPAGMPFKSSPQPQPRSPAYNTIPSSGGDDGDRRLVISQGITMSGEIEACDHLVIEGSVEAALKGARTLEVAESGVFYGAVEIEEATIAGRFEGDITVNGRLTIEGTGTITGTIAYKELQVEAGATIDGKISPLTNRKASASAPQQQQKESKNTAPRNDNASDDREELPFSGQAIAAAE